MLEDGDRAWAPIWELRKGGGGGTPFFCGKPCPGAVSEFFGLLMGLKKFSTFKNDRLWISLLGDRKVPWVASWVVSANLCACWVQANETAAVSSDTPFGMVLPILSSSSCTSSLEVQGSWLVVPFTVWTPGKRFVLSKICLELGVGVFVAGLGVDEIATPPLPFSLAGT